MVSVCYVSNFRFSAVGACAFSLGLSAFFFCCCITIWALPAAVMQDFLSHVTKREVTDPNAVYTTIVGAFLELICIVTSAMALDGIRHLSTHMMLAYVIYLPLYAIYQLVVLILMCVYVTNKSSAIAAASHITPIAGINAMWRYVLPFIPMLSLWVIFIIIYVGCVVVTICYYEQMRREVKVNAARAGAYLTT